MTDPELSNIDYSSLTRDHFDYQKERYEVLVPRVAGSVSELAQIIGVFEVGCVGAFSGFLRKRIVK